MNMKKKPPPGATLISRLKARREQQALAESNAKQGGDQKESEAPSAKAPANAQAPANNKAAEKATKPAVVEKAPLVTPEIIAAGDETITVSHAAPASDSSPKDSGSPAVRADHSVAIAAPVPVKAAVEATEFITRSISIDDLRPVSDEYIQLTEEIRLAGRFAAAGLIAQGLRLSRLKDDQIYKEHYQTFEDYCRKEHSMSATYAYRLIRMSEMAERLAEEGSRHVSHRMSQSMPDPFEVLLGLGHRHLMALLPLDVEKAEDLLIHGVPLPGHTGKDEKRIPIVKATEQQIKSALRLLLGEAPAEAPGKKAAVSPAVPSPPSVQTLAAMADRLEEWANWLEDNPPAELIAELMEEVKAGRIKDGKEIARLAQQLGSASKRILELLDPLQRRAK